MWGNRNISVIPHCVITINAGTSGLPTPFPPPASLPPSIPPFPAKEFRHTKSFPPTFNRLLFCSQATFGAYVYSYAVKGAVHLKPSHAAALNSLFWVCLGNWITSLPPLHSAPLNRVSVFWYPQGSLSLGRFISIPVAMYIKPPRMLMISLVRWRLFNYILFLNTVIVFWGFPFISIVSSWILHAHWFAEWQQGASEIAAAETLGWILQNYYSRVRNHFRKMYLGTRWYITS